MALLEVTNVSKYFGGLKANQNITFTVEQGQIVGLIGPNGAGKTTLFNCLSGFYKPEEGRIIFDGRDITGKSPERVNKLGLARTFQVVRTFKELTVLENVMVGALSRHPKPADAKRKALEWLELGGLLPKKDMTGSGLTIADKKRIEMLRALATEPKLIVLDEVMAGLRPAEQIDAVALLRQIKERGITIMLVEHVMEVVMPVADKVIVLQNGKQIAQGTPAEISRDPTVLKAYLGEDYAA
jgi:branched-chain amino acid transport system ATP-binding protein